MNFVDSYDVSSIETPAVADSEVPQQSLNEEVSQVLGQLNRFWGGFRKQSQTAIETARKDFGHVVEQAQKELGKLNYVASAEPSTSVAADVATDPSSHPEQTDEASSPSSSTTETPQASGSTATTSFSPQSLFTRLQASLPPNIVSTVQSHIPPLESIRQVASESVDFAQLRTTLTSEFQRVQDVTRAQTEEYVSKSEGLLREAVKEAGDFLKDAVKVVPPEEQDRDASVGVVWGGSDVWMLPSSYPDHASADSSSRKGKEKGDGRSVGDARRAVATRAESLLRMLRHDSEVVKADPEADDVVKNLYAEWLKREVVEKGGITSPEWMEKRKTAVNLPEDGEAIRKLQESLVPSVLTEDVFWMRYFFRAYQIEREAERRRALLQAPSDSEDAFSWEDDDDEVASPTTALSPSSKDQNECSTTTTFVSIAQVTPGTLSPRESSEDSYDVVSNNGEETKLDKAQERDDSDDSDGEDEGEGEDEDEGEDEEEESGESDWE